MRNSKVLQKIRTGRGVRICGLGHYLPFFVRYAAHNSYDAIWLDLEHRAMDQREIQGLLAMCHAHDIDCMVRAPTLERTRLYRYLEDGATGLMMPLVSDAGLAREIVEAVKYPPLGNRGLDGAGLDGDFGLDVWHEGSTYVNDANRETFIVLQIETPEALANVDEIAAVDGVDGLFVGPADLGCDSARLVATPISTRPLPGSRKWRKNTTRPGACLRVPPRRWPRCAHKGHNSWHMAAISPWPRCWPIAART